MPPRATSKESSPELSDLRSRLAEAEETLRAIRCGEVDALVTDGKNGPQVFTLEGADHAYRVLIESMTEGALTLAADMVVLYANKCFAQMVKSPLEKVMGCSFRRFLSADDLAALEPLLQRPGESDSKIQVLLNAGDGSCLPVQISIRPLPAAGSRGAAITMVVADMTQARHIEELLRNESRRAEAALIESEAKLAMAFASMTEAISIADASGRLTDFNDEFVRYHRFKNRDECSRTIADGPKYLDAFFADGTPAPPEQSAMARALRGENASNVEYRMCHKETGETWWGSYSFGPIQGKAGGFVGAVVSCRDVTERKRNEAALRYSERRFRSIFDSAFQFIGLMTPDGTVLEANRTALEAGGLRAENVIGKPFWECDWWTLTERTGRELRTAIGRAASGEMVRYDVDVRGTEGQVLTIDFSIKPIRDEAGRVVLLIPEGRDITCLKRAEENLRLTNQRFALAVKCSQVVLWQQDLELRYIWLHNPAPGIDGSDAAGKKDEDLLERAEDAAVIVALKREVIRSGVGLRKEFFPQIQGVVHGFDVLLEPLRDVSGRITGLTGAAIDITERKRAEEAIQLNKEKLHEQLARMALLEQITRGISSHLESQHILKVVTNDLEANLPVDFCCFCLFDEPARNYEVAQVGIKSTPLAVEMAMPEFAVISWDCDELAEAALGELKYLPDVHKMACPLAQRLAKGGLSSLVLAPLRMEGNIFGFLLVARRAAHSFADGDCEFLKQLSEHVALSCRQARLHNALQTAHDELRRSQQTTMQRERLRALGQMACGITHDISNAISPVTLYTASLLEHEPDLSVRARDSLQTIHQSVQNVAETITRMRDFCRQGEAQVVLTPIHLHQVAQQALDLTRVRWSDSPHERGIVIQTEIDFAEDLPDIMGVESEVRDAIVNLILNAVDAMPGGGTLTLRTVNQKIAPETGLTPDAGQACLELIDTGIGMDEDTRRCCLEPFFTTKGEHGSGMGLAMVYGMISRHRAGIDIESTPGKGTTVRMIFPVIESASRGVDRPLPAKLDPANQRILFIDDDPLLIKSMRDTLEADGHTVVTAAGGQEGIDAFMHAQEGNEAFTVVITDLGMPHVDGRKVARAVKAASPTTPVILLTGWGQRVETEGDIPAQVDRLLCKPPNLRELREAVAAAVH